MNVQFLTTKNRVSRGLMPNIKLKSGRTNEMDGDFLLRSTAAAAFADESR